MPADVVNRAPLEELIRIFREFGEERIAPRIARAIVMDRQIKPFERTLELAEMIARVARAKDSSGGRRDGDGRKERLVGARRVVGASIRRDARVPGAAHSTSTASSKSSTPH